MRGGTYMGELHIALQCLGGIAAGGYQEPVAGAHPGFRQRRAGNMARARQAEHAYAQARQERDIRKPLADDGMR